MSRRCRCSRRGLSMIEVVVSTLLVATILVVSLTASGNLLRNHSQQQAGVDGKALAAKLLDEVTALAFEDDDVAQRVFGREPDEDAADRSTWDDVDDYHGLALSPPTHRDGETIAGYSDWSLAITVTPAEPTADGVSLSGDATAPLRHIAVRCTSPAGVVHDAEAYVSRVPSDVPGGTAHQRWRSVSLTFPDGTTIDVDAPLKNQPAASGG